MKKEKNKFVIVTTRAVSPEGVKPRIHTPLGPISVLPEARAGGYEVHLFDSAAEGLKKGFSDPDYNPVEDVQLEGVAYWKTGLRVPETIRGIRKLDPDFIGLSCATVVDRGEVASLAKGLRQEFPDTPIILGGHEASEWYHEILSPDHTLVGAIPEVDYVVVGPGQPVIVPLLKYISNGGSLPMGVATRAGGKVVFLGKPLFFPSNHALPDYSLLASVSVIGRDKPMDVYSYVSNPHAGRIDVLLGSSGPSSYLPLLTSYGCGFDCSFCDTDKKLNRYSVDKVMSIIGQFEDLFGIDYIDIMDNNFAGGNPSSRKIPFEILLEMFKQNRKIGFSNGLTFESMKREDFKLLKTFSTYGNVKHIAFPCENGNARVLKMIHKPHTLEMLRAVLSFAGKNLPTTNREGFFIGGFPETNGHPAETPEEIENTYSFMREILEKRDLHQAIFLTLSPVTREYRVMWRKVFPHAPFEHCLFSKGAGIWPYPNHLLDEMRKKVRVLNEELGRAVTRKL